VEAEPEEEVGPGEEAGTAEVTEIETLEMTTKTATRVKTKPETETATPETATPEIATPEIATPEIATPETATLETETLETGIPKTLEMATETEMEMEGERRSRKWWLSKRNTIANRDQKATELQIRSSATSKQ
jgi:hypothetical protein